VRPSPQPRDERGAYAAGFLFAAPVLLALILAVVSLSNLAWRFMGLQQIATATARQMAVSGYYDACSSAIASYYASQYGFQGGSVTVTGIPGPGGPPAAYGSPVSATATASVPLFFYGLSPTVSLEAVVQGTSDYVPPSGAETPQEACGVSF
jgi:Flp pilus assembly protein TadG